MSRQNWKSSYLIFFVVIVLSLCITYWILVKFPPDRKSDSLAAIGQIVGALFSFWAFSGLVLGQYFQNISLRLQQVSIVAQQDALRDQIESSKKIHLAFLMETTSNAIDSLKISLERYAKTMIASCPSLDYEAVSKRIINLNDDIEAPHAFLIVEAEDIRAEFENQLQTGLMKNNAQSYVRLYETVRERSRTLSESIGALDQFSLEIENTSLSQLYSIIKSKFLK